MTRAGLSLSTPEPRMDSPFMSRLRERVPQRQPAPPPTPQVQPVQHAPMPALPPVYNRSSTPPPPDQNENGPPPPSDNASRPVPPQPTDLGGVAKEIPTDPGGIGMPVPPPMTWADMIAARGGEGPSGTLAYYDPVTQAEEQARRQREAWLNALGADPLTRTPGAPTGAQDRTPATATPPGAPQPDPVPQGRTPQPHINLPPSTPRPRGRTPQDDLVVQENPREYEDPRRTRDTRVARGGG